MKLGQSKNAVYLVIDDLPRDFGNYKICGAYSNKKAAETHKEAMRQIDAYANQYVIVQRMPVYDESCWIPVKKKRSVKS